MRIPPLLRHVPNALSTFRLGLAVLFPAARGVWVQTAMVLTAGITDLADGMIARRAGYTSWIGGHLDAVADKTFVLVALGTFAARGQILWWQVALLLCRDVAVALIAAYAAVTRQWIAFKRMPSRLPGKLTTAATFLFILLVACDLQWASGYQHSLFAVAATLSVVAAADYIVQTVRAQRSV